MSSNLILSSVCCCPLMLFGSQDVTFASLSCLVFGFGSEDGSFAGAFVYPCSRISLSCSCSLGRRTSSRLLSLLRSWSGHSVCHPSELAGPCAPVSCLALSACLDLLLSRWQRFVRSGQVPAVVWSAAFSPFRVVLCTPRPFTSSVVCDSFDRLATSVSPSSPVWRRIPPRQRLTVGSVEVAPSTPPPGILCWGKSTIRFSLIYDYFGSTAMPMRCYQRPILFVAPLCIFVLNESSVGFDVASSSWQKEQSRTKTAHEVDYRLLISFAFA